MRKKILTAVLLWCFTMSAKGQYTAPATDGTNFQNLNNASITITGSGIYNVTAFSLSGGTNVINVGSGVTLQLTGFNINSGLTLTFEGAGEVNVTSGSITNGSTLNINVATFDASTVNISVNSSASLSIGSGSSATFNNITNDASVVVDGTLTGDISTNNSGASVSGSGNYIGNVTTNDGTIFGSTETSGSCPAPSGCSTSTPLPVDLIYFRSILEDSGVRLLWSTASETNNDFFTLEKSENGLDFEKIGVIDGAGQSTQQLEYDFMDKSDWERNSVYYRLSQTDYDGTVELFEIIAVRLRTKSSFFPSMIDAQTSEVYFENQFTNGPAQFTLTDLSGKEWSMPYTLQANKYTIFLPESLSKGVYVLTGSLNDQFVSQKLLHK